MTGSRSLTPPGVPARSRPPLESPMRPPVARAFALMCGAAMAAVAYRRGHLLLGAEVGVLYAGVAVGLVWLVARLLTRTGRPFLPRAVAAVAVTVPIAAVMADPAAVSPDLQHFIDKQATDREARRELAAVFATDPSYADLTTSTAHVKVVNVTVRGLVGGRPDLDRLRARVAAECPAVQRCVLHWDVRFRDTGGRFAGLDRELTR